MIRDARLSPSPTTISSREYDFIGAVRASTTNVIARARTLSSSIRYRRRLPRFAAVNKRFGCWSLGKRKGGGRRPTAGPAIAEQALQPTSRATRGSRRRKRAGAARAESNVRRTIVRFQVASGAAADQNARSSRRGDAAMRYAIELGESREQLLRLCPIFSAASDGSSLEEVDAEIRGAIEFISKACGRRCTYSEPAKQGATSKCRITTPSARPPPPAAPGCSGSWARARARHQRQLGGSRVRARHLPAQDPRRLVCRQKCHEVLPAWVAE